MKPTVKNLICEGGLHYCCTWAFFKKNRNTALIALRLGMSQRAVRQEKSRAKNGECSCEDKANCMKEKLK